MVDVLQNFRTTLCPPEVPTWSTPAQPGPVFACNPEELLKDKNFYFRVLKASGTERS